MTSKEKKSFSSTQPLPFVVGGVAFTLGPFTDSAAVRFCLFAAAGS